MVAAIVEQTSLDVAALADMFEVSQATVRRDLETLEQQRLVHRTHGGATTHAAFHDLPLSYKTAQDLPEKRRIADHALTLLDRARVIGVTGGTTVTEFARGCSGRRGPHRGHQRAQHRRGAGAPAAAAGLRRRRRGARQQPGGGRALGRGVPGRLQPRRRVPRRRRGRRRGRLHELRPGRRAGQRADARAGPGHRRAGRRHQDHPGRAGARCARWPTSTCWSPTAGPTGPRSTRSAGGAATCVCV